MTTVGAAPAAPIVPTGVAVAGAPAPSRGALLAGPSFASFLARPRPAAASSGAGRVAASNAGPTAHAPHASARGRALPAALRSLPADASGSEDPLDPLHRRRAALAPPQGLTFPPALTAAAPPAPALAPEPSRALAAAALEHLLPALVRRIAWSGDGRRGTARLEIGAGDLAGAVLRIDADEGRVRVHLDVPPGVDARAWHERIERSLRDRHVATDVLEVT